MITSLKKYSRLFLLVALLPACSKQKGFGSNYSDYNPAETPITIANSIGNRPDPTVTCSLSSSDSSITVTLSIAGTTKHTIKEITKVAASSGYTAIQSTGTTGFYPVAVIPGAGATVTFKTTLGVYRSLFKTETIKLNTELTNRFFFRITLDDGSIVYPTPARVLIVS